MSGTLSSQIAAARRALEQAVRDGNDSRPARDYLTALQSDLATANENRKRTEIAAVTGDVRVGQAEAAERRAAVLAALPPMPNLQPLAVLDADGAHTAATTALVAARRMAELARGEAAHAAAEVANLADRLADVERQRGEIARRRNAGDRRPGDGGEVELLAMDATELREMQARTRPRATEAAEAVRRADAAFLDAERRVEEVETVIASTVVMGRLVELDRIASAMEEETTAILLALHGKPAEAVLDLVAARLAQLDARLLVNVELLKGLQVRAGVNRKPRWGASQRLRMALSDLAISRGDF